MERAIIEEKNGEHVVFVTCDGSLRGCGAIACNSSLICPVCKDKRNKATQLLSENLQNISFESLALNDESKVSLDSIQNIEELKEFEVDGNKIGLTVASTLISKYRDPNLRLSPIIKREAEEAANKALALFKWADDFLKKKTVKRVIFFNGRLTLTRPLVWASEKNKIPYYCLEQGGDIYKYIYLHNYLPHDRLARKQEIQDYWNSSDEPEDVKIEKGKKFYEERVGGIIQNYVVYTTEQKAGLIPEALKTNKRKVVVFLSSEDEYAAVDGWDNPFFKDTIFGLRWIFEATREARERGDLHVCVRSHPNLAGLKNDQTREIESFKNEKECSLILPLDAVDSYSLAKVSDLVVVFGSTIGIESAYAGKEVLLLSTAIYEDVGSFCVPKNLCEAREVILGIRPVVSSSHSKLETIKFGYWLRQFGIPYKYYEAESISTGKILGVKIWPNFILNLMFLLGRLHFLVKAHILGKFSLYGIYDQYKKYKQLRLKLEKKV